MTLTPTHRFSSCDWAVSMSCWISLSSLTGVSVQWLLVWSILDFVVHCYLRNTSGVLFNTMSSHDPDKKYNLHWLFGPLLVHQISKYVIPLKWYSMLKQTVIHRFKRVDMVGRWQTCWDSRQEGFFLLKIYFLFIYIYIYNFFFT